MRVSVRYPVLDTEYPLTMSQKTCERYPLGKTRISDRFISQLLFPSGVPADQSQLSVVERRLDDFAIEDAAGALWALAALGYTVSLKVCVARIGCLDGR